MINHPASTIRDLVILFVSMGCVFSARGQDTPIRMLGPVKTFGVEHPQSFSFRGTDVLKIEYGSRQALYDIESGKLIVSSFDQNRAGVDYSPATGQIVYPDDHGKIAIAHWQDGVFTPERTSQNFSSRNLRFSNDGTRILAGDSFLSMYDAETDEILWSFSPDGSVLVELQWNQTDGVIEIAESASPTRLQLISDASGESLFSDFFQFGYYPGVVEGGRHTVYSNLSGDALLLDHETGLSSLFTLDENKQVARLQLLHDNTTILGIGVINVRNPMHPGFFIKNLTDDSNISWLGTQRQAEGFADKVTAFALSENESHLLLGTESGRFESWDFAGQQLNRVVGNAGSRILTIRLFDDAKRAAIGTADERIQLWNLDTDSTYSASMGGSFVISEDESRIAFKSTDGTIQVMRSTDGEFTGTYPKNEKVAICARFISNDEFEVLYRDGTSIRYDASSNEEISRREFDWPFFEVAGKYDNSPLLIGVAENTYIANWDNGDILETLDINVINSISNNYNKLSSDGSKFMARVRSIDSGDSVQFIDLTNSSVLVKANGTTSNLYTDLSLDGNLALIYYRSPDEENTIEVNAAANQYILAPEPGSRFRLVLVNLQTGEYSESPHFNFPRSLRDAEFSLDGSRFYLQQGTDLYVMNTETWDYERVTVPAFSRVDNPVNLLNPQGESDWLIYRDRTSKTIIDPSNGDYLGTINHRLAQVTVSNDGERAASLYDGMVTRYDFREGKYIQGRLHRPSVTQTWTISIPSKSDSFYRIQESMNLEDWKWIEYTVQGTGENIQTTASSLTDPYRLFFRTAEFPKPIPQN